MNKFQIGLDYEIGSEVYLTRHGRITEGVVSKILIGMNGVHYKVALRINGTPDERFAANELADSPEDLAAKLVANYRKEEE